MKKDRVLLLVGTIKGAFLYQGDPSRRSWKLSGPHFLGSVAHHIVLDPRDGRTILMAARTGHLGPTVFRSTDWGKNWKEAKQPPAFPKVKRGKGRTVKQVFWLTPGHETEPGVWYAGTSPHGLFRTKDSGETWDGVEGFNNSADYRKWTKYSDTPGGPLTHSILVDPRDRKHLYLGMATGGFFESVNAGRKWKPLNKGCAADFLPVENPEYGHDPHCVVQHPKMPDRFYMQNHCGIYRLDRPSDTWERIGNNMPKRAGDIGFPMVVHPEDPDTAWVFPMNGTDVWPRTSPDAKPAVYRTSNAGKTWQRQDKGLPEKHAWWTVLRQCFAADHSNPVGLYFGTTSGEIWMSRNEGGKWQRILAHEPDHAC